MNTQQFIFSDCVEGMKAFPDLHFDLAIVDLQQGNGNAADIAKKSGGIYGFKNVKRGNYKVKTWDNKRMGPEYFKELIRVSKNQIIWCGQFYTDLLPPSRGWLAWNKLNGTNHWADIELAWTSFDMPNRMFTFLWNGMMQGQSLKRPDVQRGNKQTNQKRIHETQKPIELYDWLVSKFGKPGYRLLDTHVGSASSLISFSDNGFDYVGFENDIDHFNNACNRMANHNPMYFKMPEIITSPSLRGTKQSLITNP